MSDETKKTELHETDLEAAAGGIRSRETVDSHDPDICNTFTETDHRCLGLLTKTPCEYHQLNTVFSDGRAVTVHSYCLKGYYDYKGPAMSRG